METDFTPYLEKVERLGTFLGPPISTHFHFFSLLLDSEEGLSCESEFNRRSAYELLEELKTLKDNNF